jgi:hypothetical protein
VNAETIFESMRVRWPQFKPARDAFLEAWGPEVERVPEADGLRVLATHARQSRFAPSVAEFLEGWRQLKGVSTHGPRQTVLPCPGCAVKVAGAVALAKHEATCAAAEALYEAGRKLAVEALAAFKTRLRGAL